MSGEKLFEGMGHVSEGFVEEAEQSELPKATRSPWRMGAAVAACLGVIMLSAVLLSKPEGPNASAEKAPGEPAYGFAENFPAGGIGGEATYGFAGNLPAGGMGGEPGESILLGAAYFRTNALSQAGSFPQTLILRSFDELEQYVEENQKSFDLSSIELSSYTSGYFMDYDLILLVLEEGSGSVRHQVQTVRPWGDVWSIAVRRLVPEVCTADMAQWHILLTVEKGAVARDDKLVIEQLN